MKLFPSDLDNQYKGSKLIQYGLYPIFAIYIFRSLVHFLAESSGLVGIASIKEFPITDGIDPNNLIYLFASYHNNNYRINFSFQRCRAFKNVATSYNNID